MYLKTIKCLQCNRETLLTRSTKKFCSNKCRVKYHRIQHGLSLRRENYDPYEMIECNVSECENYGSGLARCILKKMGCLGRCC